MVNDELRSRLDALEQRGTHVHVHINFGDAMRAFMKRRKPDEEEDKEAPAVHVTNESPRPYAS